MKESVRATLEEIAAKYDPRSDFDGVLSRYTAQLIAPRVHGRRTLECGCGMGLMTAELLKAARELEVEEGSEINAAAAIRLHEGLIVHRALFEEFSPAAPFEEIVLASALHHAKDPVALLRHMRSWLSPGGALHITVPNIASLHRRLGVAMGVAKHVTDPSPRNVFFKQPGRFTRETLVEVVEASGLRVTETEGFFVKPFPNAVMVSLQPANDIMDGLFELGKRMPEIAAQLYLRAEAS